MKLRLLILLAALTLLSACKGREEAAWLEFPLPLDTSRSAEIEDLLKPVECEELLPIKAHDWAFAGIGRMELTDSCIIMTHPMLTGQRAVGPEGDRDYATLGECTVRCDLHGRDLSSFNRVYMKVYADCGGERAYGLNLSVGGSEGHLVNFRNKVWNEAYLDLDDMPRESIEGLSLSTTIKGKDGVNGDTARFVIKDIRFQKVSDPEIRSGWEPMPGRIIYSMSGYFADGMKTAIVRREETGKFYLVDKAGKVVLDGNISPVTTTIGSFGVIDFTSFGKKGRYRLKTEHDCTELFSISGNPFKAAAPKVLSGIFGLRCGYPVKGVHNACHTDLMALHKGDTIVYSGGWHDAGDLSQQTLQTGDVAFALLEAFEAVKGTRLGNRLLDEALWGLDFIVKTRFRDGYRASSMGLLHWTDGVVGTYDDIVTVRTQNLAFDNYLYAAYEAFAAMTVPDDAQKKRFAKAAEEDFAFAERRFAETGFEPFAHIMEHSYNTSESQYMATVAWAAGMLYRLTGDSKYAGRAAEAMRFVLSCQQTEPIGDMCGFFWRTPRRRSIVHFIHQSRDQVFAQALTLLCTVLPQHQDAPLWEAALRRYAEYLKKLMFYTEPYGMVPSGVYKDDEYEDTDDFYRLHIFAPEDAPLCFAQQFAGGAPVAKGYAVRRFPIWFNIFNGNNAIILSTGKAAAICGKYLGDRQLLDIGREQLYWVVGKNPFGQSMIYGEGHRYPQMSAFSSGELTGEMPVGIRSLGEADEPYWPAVNNACYKEVWATSSGKFLSLLSEYINN